MQQCAQRNGKGDRAKGIRTHPCRRRRRPRPRRVCLHSTGQCTWPWPDPCGPSRSSHCPPVPLASAWPGGRRSWARAARPASPSATAAHEHGRAREQGASRLGRRVRRVAGAEGGSSSGGVLATWAAAMAAAAAEVVTRAARVAAAVARARGAASCTAMRGRELRGGCWAASAQPHPAAPCWKSFQAGWPVTVLCDETSRRVLVM